MLKSRLAATIATDEYAYFFTLLADRFSPLNQRWQKGLEARFNRPFRPIYVLPFHHNPHFEEDNYIVLNEKLDRLHASLGSTDIIDLIYPEDLNRQFSRSPTVKSLTKQLIKKQGTVFVLSFTSVWLDVDDANVVVLGPDSRVAARYDAKTEHTKTFKKVGLPTIHSKIHRNFQKLREAQTQYPYFLSAMYSSGGIESRAIHTPADLDLYYAGLRELNKVEPLIASTFVADIAAAPNVSALVTGPDQTAIVCISDQILRNNQYMGNLYPSQISTRHREFVASATIKVGNYLSREGFRGLFGVDFLISKAGECYPVDLNPRRQGGYYCQAMAAPCDLIDLELRLIFGESIPALSDADFQSDYAWGHSKLTPYFPSMKILSELNMGHPTEPFEKVGATHLAIYYPKDHRLRVGNPGFYVTSGRTYNEVKQRLIEQTEKAISTSYELYEG